MENLLTQDFMPLVFEKAIYRQENSDNNFLDPRKGSDSNSA